MFAIPLSMNVLRFLGACAVIAVPALCAAACSSKTTKITSGGAIYRLQTQSPSTVPGGSCLDPTTTIRISVTGDDGGQKLIADGAENATISCTYDDSGFNVVAQQNGAGLVAFGKWATAEKKSSNATMQFIVTGNTYKSPSNGCTINFDPIADNSLVGHFVCPEVSSSKVANDVCGVQATTTSGAPFSFFRFADCNPS